jgi:O-antigen ligase
MFILLLIVYQSCSLSRLMKGMGWSFSLLGILITSWGLFELFTQVVDGHLEVPTDTYHVRVFFLHRNLFAQVLMITFFFQVYQVLRSRQKSLTLLFSVSAFANLFLIITLSARAVWLSTSVSFMTLILLFYVTQKINKYFGGKPDIRHLTILTAIIIAAVLSAVAFYEVYAIKDKMITHVSSITKMDEGSGGDRIQLWDHTIKMIREEPIFGKGLANWKIEVLKYGNENLKSDNNDTFYQRPHNDYLWIFAETGIVGLILYLLMLLFAFYSGIRLISKEPDKTKVLFQIIVLSTLSGFLTFSFFSFPRERIVQSIYLIMFLAAVLVHRQEFRKMEAQVKVVKSRLFWLSVILVLGFLSYIGYVRLNGETNLKKAMQAKDRKDYDNLIVQVDRASSRLYEMDPTSTPLLWYKGFGFYQKEEFMPALDAFSKAFHINPYHIHVLNNLGSSWYKTGHADSSVKYYLKALVIAPNFEESRLNLSAVLFNQKMTDSAYSVIKKVDVNTEDSRYPEFLKVILKARISEAFRGDSIPDLPDDEAWYLTIHKMSVEQDRSIEKLIFEQEIFIPNEHPRHE